ncbi:hypothetical protein BOSP111201_08235 [Bordetella sputigena]|uniref:hypothetical protein n=1 Tax=Bordetella sputigena TaxID=1416810 RepID=UPI0039F14CFA
MTLPFSTSLALRQLRHNDPGLIATFAGVCVVVVLVFIQLGFKNAVTDSVLNFARALDADIVMSGPSFETVADTPPSFARALVYQARDVAGVSSAMPVYVRMSQSSMTEGGSPLAVRIIGFSATDGVLKVPGLQRQLARLRPLYTALLDARSRGRFADRVQEIHQGEIPRIYLRNAIRPDGMFELKRDAQAGADDGAADAIASHVDMIGTFRLGPDFTFPGNLIVSDLTFFRLFEQSADRVSLGLVKIVPGANAGRVRDELARRMRGSAQVWLKDDFVEAERGYFAHRTPVGIVTTFGILVGILIGVVFVLEVLRGITESNLALYAALRAAGYGTGFFLALMMQLALFVAVAAFATSLAITIVLYEMLERITQLTFSMTASTAASVLLATLAMSILAAALAARRLPQGDPIDLFA